MKYKITFRKRASKEYLDALLWYKVRSIDAASNFVKAIDETLEKIAGNPAMFRNSYKSFTKRPQKNTRSVLFTSLMNQRKGWLW